MVHQVLLALQACHGSSCSHQGQSSSTEADSEEVGCCWALQAEVLLLVGWYVLLQMMGLVPLPAQP